MDKPKGTNFHKSQICLVHCKQTVSRPVKLQFPDLQLGATQEGAWLLCRWAERTMLYSLALINRFIATTSQDCAPLC